MAAIQSQRVGKNRFEVDLDLRVRSTSDLGAFIESLSAMSQVEIVESTEQE